MINLLPPERQQQLHRDYRQRVLVTGAFLFSWLLAMALVLLAALYWFVHRERLATAQAVAADQAAVAQSANLANSLELFDRQLTLLGGLATTTSFTVATQTLLSDQTAGISFSELAYQRTGEGVQLRLTGLAQTRDQLLALLDRLRADKLFKQVDSPVSNLIKNQQAPFVITLQINGT